MQSPYVTTVEEGQGTKPDPRGPHIFIPRIHRGDWHHLALAWTNGLVKTTVSMFLNGKLVIRPSELPGKLWADMEATSFRLMNAPNHDNIAVDELRISDIARSPEQITNAFTRGAFVRDEHTLLLDHFDTLGTNETSAAQISGYGGEQGGKLVNTCYELVDGNSGRRSDSRRSRSHETAPHTDRPVLCAHCCLLFRPEPRHQRRRHTSRRRAREFQSGLVQGLELDLVNESDKPVVCDVRLVLFRDDKEVRRTERQQVQIPAHARHGFRVAESLAYGRCRVEYEVRVNGSVFASDRSEFQAAGPYRLRLRPGTSPERCPSHRRTASPRRRRAVPVQSPRQDASKGALWTREYRRAVVEGPETGLARRIPPSRRS